MKIQMQKRRVGRREFLYSSAAAITALASVSVPKMVFAAEKTVKIGFLPESARVLGR